jgi:hypothetical protein
MAMRSTVLILLALGLSAQAQAEIFQWTDSKGTIHFTDDYDRVPPLLKGSDRLIIRSDLPSGSPTFPAREEEARLDAIKPQEPPEPESSPAPAAGVYNDSRDIQVVVNSFGNLNGGKHCLVPKSCRSQARFDFNDRRYIHPSVFDKRPKPRVHVAPSGRHRGFFWRSRFSASKIRRH